MPSEPWWQTGTARDDTPHNITPHSRAQNIGHFSHLFLFSYKLVQNLFYEQTCNLFWKCRNWKIKQVTGQKEDGLPFFTSCFCIILPHLHLNLQSTIPISLPLSSSSPSLHLPPHLPPHLHIRQVSSLEAKNELKMNHQFCCSRTCHFCVVLVRNGKLALTFVKYGTGHEPLRPLSPPYLYR